MGNLILAILCLGSLIGVAAPAYAQEPLTVVELFTSQGCSSCPPADRLVRDLSKEAGILALSFHVDYWNYIGWDDPYSLPAATHRQRAYARALGLRHVYTPQIVVQGSRDVLGSDEKAVRRTIEDSRHEPRLSMTATVLQDGRMRIDIASDLASPGPASGELLLVTFDREHETVVARGENRGRVLVNANVVREFVPLGIWRGEPSSVLPMPALASGNQRGRALLLQARGPGKILAATRL